MSAQHTAKDGGFCMLGHAWVIVGSLFTTASAYSRGMKDFETRHKQRNRPRGPSTAEVAALWYGKREGLGLKSRR
jgi:hypothetical protein